MRSKIRNLNLNVHLTEYDILVIVETWLDSSISNNELGLSGFSLYRCDRFDNNKTRDGGVMIAVRSNLNSSILNVSSNIEELYVKVGTNLILSSVYIPPGSGSALYVDYCNSINYICNLYPNFKFVFCGDFNLPRASWDPDCKTILSSSNNCANVQILAESLEFHSLNQTNCFPNNRNVLIV